jgi:ABC-type lipopolysaccharide export system ATPase subunit
MSEINLQDCVDLFNLIMSFIASWGMGYLTAKISCLRRLKDMTDIIDIKEKQLLRLSKKNQHLQNYAEKVVVNSLRNKDEV